ncbi:hypothetical protein [Curtobacterium sp. Curtsp57]|uniref:hypothetical protein n=1 Tax=Curtobacterium sp. Curtsp57 TaxID=3243047 RepID=UPI0039B51925
MTDTMLVRRGDVVHTRNCSRAQGVKVTPVEGPPIAGMNFCSLCGPVPEPGTPAGRLGAQTIGRRVSVPASGLDEAFAGRLLSVGHDGSVTGRTVTTLTFEPTGTLGRCRVLTVDSAVRVEVRS